MRLLIKQQKIKTRGLISTLEQVPTSQKSSTTSKDDQVYQRWYSWRIDQGHIGFEGKNDWIKKFQIVNPSKIFEGSKRFVEWCM